MRSILIGSRAGRFHFPDFPREPKDIDYAWSGDKIVCEVLPSGMRKEMYPIPPVMEMCANDIGVISADDLYTLKVSHIFWDKKWNKTMYDIVWLQKKGCRLNEPLFYALYKHWEGVHGLAPRANLDMNVQEFFDNGIMDGHSHDNLHIALMNGEPATYNKVLKEKDGVAIDEEKFWMLPYQDQLNIIREEVMVMAYERGVRQGRKDYRTGYSEQLKAWILHHGPSIEMALFAVRNFDVLRKPLINYKTQINEYLQRA